MNNIHSSLERAQRQLALADHLLTATYPLSKDPKLLIGVLRNIHKAQDDVITATIAFFTPKQIVLKDTSFVVKLAKFKHVTKERNISSNQEMNMLEQTNNLFEKHEESIVEFARKSTMVLADDAYQLNVLNQLQLKNILSLTRILMKKILLTVSN